MQKLQMMVKRYLTAVVVSLFFVLFYTGSVSGASVSTSTNIVKVHYLDVGQADSILIQCGAANMLIDAGNRDDDVFVGAYLKKHGVIKLDYVVGTHPHEDHIGGLATIVKDFDVAKIIMPKVTANTRTFENLLTAIKRKGLKITTPVAGSSFKLGTADFTILSPNSGNYDDLNNYSVVLRMVYGKNAFLFQGDAESVVEQEILKKGYQITADVIKLGHHGSNSSSSSAYLDKVKPKYAVISCGKNNDYGHPHGEVLKRLTDKRIKYFRTDNNGTIICTSDGRTIKVALEKESADTGSTMINNPSGNKTGSSAGAEKSITVYVTKSGTKYHLDGCDALKNSKIKTTLRDAKAKGYQPCKSCKPPQ